MEKKVRKEEKTKLGVKSKKVNRPTFTFFITLDSSLNGPGSIIII